MSGDISASLRWYARFNDEWGRVVEGQPAKMRLAADALDEMHEALRHLASEVRKAFDASPFPSLTEALAETDAILSKMEGK